MNGRDMLRRIGRALDEGSELRVLSGGVLWPSVAPTELTTLGDEGVITNGAREREGGRQGAERESSHSATPSRTAGSEAGPRAAGAAAPEFSATGVTDQALIATGSCAVPALTNWPPEFDGVATEYPHLVLRRTSPGIWISGSLAPVARYLRSASLVMVVPDKAKIPVRAWAWSDTGVGLGPRHVNPDGSICAFEPGEPNETLVGWRRGQPVLALLDLISTWIARYFYLSEFGRWPGMQALHTALERIEWQQPGELCGCPDGKRPYALCHQPTDVRLTEAQLLSELPKGMTLWQAREGLHRRWPPLSVEGIRRAASVPAPVPTQWRAR